MKKRGISTVSEQMPQLRKESGPVFFKNTNSCEIFGKGVNL